MLNESIIQLYVDHGTLAPDFTIDTTPDTILEKLTEANIKYTWETVKETEVNSDFSAIEVRVYMPGNILYGRHVYATTNSSNAHLHAISNAVKTIVKKSVLPTLQQSYDSGKKEMPEQQTSTQALSQEEILNMVQQSIPTTPNKITTVEQLNNDPREEIPFDEIDIPTSELDNLLSGNNIYNNQDPTKDAFGNQIPQQAQQPTSRGFTQEQINAINEFKNKVGIVNDEMFNSYINAWNNKFSKKSDLTPENIDSFIEWTNSLGKAPC